MLVVDRREDIGNYQPGDNRAEVQAARKLDADAATMQVESRVQLGDVLTGPTGAEGVAILTDSPGPQVLAKIMLERIWGLCGDIQ